MPATAEVKGKMTMDASQVQTAIEQAEASVHGFSASSVASFGAVAGGMAGLVMKVIDVAVQIASLPIQFARSASELVKLSSAIGVSASQLLAWKNAARSTGADADGFAQKIVKMLASQEEAARGNKELTEAFGRLGISSKELTSLAPDELLKRVAQGAQQDGSAISDLNKIMGKGAAAEYSATLKKLAEEGMGGTNAKTEKTVIIFKNLNTAWETAKAQLEQGLMNLLAPLAEGLIKVVVSVEELLSAFMRLGAAQGAFKFIGILLEGFGKLLGIITELLGGLAQLYEMINKKFGINLGPSGDTDSQIAEAESDRKAQAAARAKEMESERKAKEEEERTKERKKLQEELTRLEERKAHIADSITVAGPKAADAMAAYGGFVGSQTSTQENSIRRQITEQEKTNDFLKEYGQKMDELKAAIEKLE